MEPEEEIVRLLVSMLKKQFSSQSETILELKRIGFGQSRIAELLGTTPNAVNQAIQKGKKTPTGRKGDQGVGLV